MVKRKIETSTKTEASAVKKTKTIPNGVHEKVEHRSHTLISGIGLAFGEGDVGQIGLGPDIMERAKPAIVPDIPDPIVQACAGGMHTVLLTKKGKVYTFGCNDEGALGRHTPEEDDSSAPGCVDFDLKVIQVSAGDSHTAALTEDGRVFIWGIFRDANGRIGLTPEGKMSLVPIQILKEAKVKKIVSGTDHLACLTLDGDIYTVGNAEQGQLGRVAEFCSNRGGRKGLGLLLNPGRVTCRKRKTKFQDVWAGQYGTYAQEINDGPIHAWGLNNYFQLGFDDEINRFMPEQVKALEAEKKWLEVSGGQHHALALDSQGKVYAFGRKDYGRLGLGENTENASKPTLIKSLANEKCVRINSGTAVSYAVTDKGKLYGWGMGSKQLAQKEEEDLWEPELLEGKQLESRNVVTVSSGGQHTVLLAVDK